MKLYKKDSQLELEMKAALACELPLSLRHEMHQNILKGMELYRIKRRRNRFIVMAVGVTALLVMSTGLVVFGGILKMKLVPASITKEEKPFQYPPHVQVIANENKLSPADQEKCKLLEKVAYAYENFQTIKGNFIVQDSTIKIQPAANIEFQVREGGNTASYEKRVLTGSPTIHEFVTNGQYGYSPQDGLMQFMQFPSIQNRVAFGPKYFIEKMDPAPPEAPPQKYMYGVPHDPAGTLWAKQVIAPLGDIPNYLLNLNEWEIAGHETVLSRTATTVTGFARGLNFKLWFDQQTGILLKEEFYNGQGTVVKKLVVESLSLNVPLDENLINISQTTINKLKQEQKDEFQKLKSLPYLETAPADSGIPKSILAKWDAAKQEPNHTTIFLIRANGIFTPKKASWST